LLRHLDGEVGWRRRALMETREIGRTEQFTPVRVVGEHEPGDIVELSIAGHDGTRLYGASRAPDRSTRDCA
jgi:threonylcarbamoyladenosine tRNA methylthiotransferase MtaB